jgi:hypothetical protein
MNKPLCDRSYWKRGIYLIKDRNENRRHYLNRIRIPNKINKQIYYLIKKLIEDKMKIEKVIDDRIISFWQF